MKRACLALVSIVVAISICPVIVSPQSANADLTGTWRFDVTTSAGSGTPTITLKQMSGDLTGHYSGQLGEADLTGSVKGQEFVFKFTVELQGVRLVNTYTGSVDGKDSLKGTVDIAGLGAGTFTARRQ
jgi:hypothetical protein